MTNITGYIPIKALLHCKLSVLVLPSYTIRTEILLSNWQKCNYFEIVHTKNNWGKHKPLWLTETCTYTVWSKSIVVHNDFKFLKPNENGWTAWSMNDDGLNLQQKLFRHRSDMIVNLACRPLNFSEKSWIILRVLYWQC